MRLEGWNHVPAGYGARFEMDAAPLWLRAWFCTPLIDRFAYPIAVRRGCGYLTPNPVDLEEPPEQFGDVGDGWRIDAESFGPTGQFTRYSPANSWGLLTRTRRRFQGWQFTVRLPRGVLLERRAMLFWRVRLLLWLVFGTVGWLLATKIGAALGVVVAVIVEAVISYRPQRNLS